MSMATTQTNTDLHPLLGRYDYFERQVNYLYDRFVFVTPLALGTPTSPGIHVPTYHMMAHDAFQVSFASLEVGFCLSVRKQRRPSKPVRRQPRYVSAHRSFSFRIVQNIIVYGAKQLR